MLERDLRKPPQSHARVKPADVPVVLETGKIFAGRREILIEHGKELYRLRLTAANRLILTK